MSEQNPYDQLGVSEGASFDEIQSARNRLCAELQGDAEQLKKIEAAYDAVLMDRLKMRQEGRIKVPDGIRFAERQAESPPNPPKSIVKSRPAWLDRLIDTPSSADIWMPAGVMTALMAIAIFVPNAVQLALILGVGAAFYFLYRKEQKLGRTVLLSFAGLLIGLVVGGLLYGLIYSQFPAFVVGIDEFASAFTFLVLWLISSFLR
ncbi:DnaJ-class molecular chaperone with C-terminal Zn finger domain [Leptolyngbyaceae cyanobacterium JSC-12]|nr:DnaJ-class molecular chaperone with C-terminal Zn finger domain [Leptolyngbyaceae cyanobacterium JSC-12]